MINQADPFEVYWVSPNSFEYDAALKQLTDRLGRGLPDTEFKNIARVIWNEAQPKRTKRTAKRPKEQAK